MPFSGTFSPGSRRPGELGNAKAGREMEGAPLAERTFDPNTASHHLHDLARNRQSQTRAPKASGGRAIRLREGVKDAGLFFRSDADARVLHAEVKARDHVISGLPLDGQVDLASFGEFQRVPQQVDQNLAQPAGVAHQSVGHVRLDAAIQLQAFLVGAQGQRLQGRLDAGLQPEINGF